MVRNSPVSLPGLRSDGKLNRKVEYLPDELTMSERYASGHPLTRAEIGVLLVLCQDCAV